MDKIWSIVGNISAILTIISFFGILGAGKVIFKIIKNKNNNSGTNLGVISNNNNGIIKNKVNLEELNVRKK